MAHDVLDNGICETCSDEEPLGEDEHALLTAIEEITGRKVASRSFNPDKHPRNPKGSPGGGRFRSLVDRLKDAIDAHAKGDGKGHPFDGFSREQLRRVAKARGIELKRGESRDSIAEKLLAHIGAPGPKAGHKVGHYAIRDDLRQARTTHQVTEALSKALPHAHVDFEDADPQTAREYAEGILRAVDEFPAVKVSRVGLVDGDGLGEHFEERDGSAAFMFGRELARDRAKFDAEVGKRVDSGEVLPGGRSGVWVANHEVGHALDHLLVADFPREPFSVRAMRIVREEMKKAGLDPSNSAERRKYITEQIDEYAATHGGELVGQAFADDMLNGDSARPLSKKIMAALRAEYADKFGKTARSRGHVSATRSAHHVLDNGICITCRPMASRGHFDPSLHPHDPHSGKFITTGGILGALLPDDANLFDTEKDWARYESLYQVVDESTVNGFTAVSTALGEAQVAFDDGSHRYIIADTTPDGMRELGDTIDKLVEEYHSADDLEPDDNGLLDYLPWGEDEELVVGFDAAGDFRFTAKDANGKPFDLPELTVEQAQKFADALNEQADTAEEQG